MAALNWEIRRHQVAIAGNVINALTGLGVAGAEVKIAAGAVQVETSTGQDGHFHFLDLPDGIYPVEVRLHAAGNRYGTAQVNATVSRDGLGNIQIASADLQLPATTIRGQINRPNNKPAVMAEIQLTGSRERVLSDADGHYALVGVETGSRTLTVTTQKFQPHVQTVILATAGEIATVDVTLTPS